MLALRQHLPQLTGVDQQRLLLLPLAAYRPSPWHRDLTPCLKICHLAISLLFALCHPPSVPTFHVLRGSMKIWIDLDYASAADWAAAMAWFLIWSVTRTAPLPR